MIKDVHFHKAAKKSLASYPSEVKARIMKLIMMLANKAELQPNDFKSMKSIGNGVYELRVNMEKQYRNIYVTKFPEAIYILHSFVKKQQKTPQKEIEIARRRYKLLLKERK